METVSHLAIARRQGFLPADVHASLKLHAARLARLLSGLRKSLGDK